MIKSRRMRWTGNVTRKGKRSNAYRDLVGESERRRLLRRSRHRWNDNIKMDTQEVMGRCGLDRSV
jgi:hypothetical protein